MLSYADVWAIVNRWGIRMRRTRLRNLTLLVHGLLTARSACLSTIVRHWSFGPSRHIHRLKRLHRFLKNPAVQVAPLFRPLAAIVWPYRPGGRRTRHLPLALDWTKVRTFHVLWAAVPRNRRALPLAFGVYHPSRLRHSQNKLERALLTLAASLLPEGFTPLILADAGFGQTELLRWLQNHGFAYVIHLRPDTLIHYRGRTFPLGELDTLQGAPILLTQVQYRGQDPVCLNLVISRQGDQVWYLGTSFTDAQQAVAWYRKRFWIEEMFRDFKSTLGLRKVQLKDEQRLARLLLGYQIAYLILFIIGFNAPKRWQRYLCSRDRLSLIWFAARVLLLATRPRHRKVWRRLIWPALLLQSG